MCAEKSAIGWVIAVERVSREREMVKKDRNVSQWVSFDERWWIRNKSFLSSFLHYGFFRTEAIIIPGCVKVCKNSSGDSNRNSWNNLIRRLPDFVVQLMMMITNAYPQFLLWAREKEVKIENWSVEANCMRQVLKLSLCVPWLTLTIGISLSLSLSRGHTRHR